MNRDLTPSQLAKLAGVHATTILKAIQDGRIEVHSTPGGHHRISRLMASAFLEALGIPPAALQRRKVRVLLVSADAGLAREVTARRDGRFEVEVASQLVSAGVAIGRFNPDIVIADGRVAGLLSPETLACLRAEPRSKIVALADLSRASIGRDVDAWVSDPLDIDEIHEKIRDLARSTDLRRRMSA